MTVIPQPSGHRDGRSTYMLGRGQLFVLANKCRRRNNVIRMTLETRLMQAHVMLHVAQKDEHGSKFVTLARHGAYEVRLVELASGSASDFMFWIELFDCTRRVSIDSGGANDVDEASAMVNHLALRAATLSEEWKTLK